MPASFKRKKTVGRAILTYGNNDMITLEITSLKKEKEGTRNR